MNNATAEQQRISRKIAKRKEWLQLNYPLCIFCGHRADNGDLVHLIRRSDRLPGVTREDLQTYPGNTWLGHRDCHDIYDDQPHLEAYLPQIDLVESLKAEIVEHFTPIRV